MKKLQEIANASFEKNKDLKKVFVTEDGHPFASRNAANLHATTNPKSVKTGKILKVTEFEAPKIDKVVKADKPSHEDRIEKVKSLTTIEDVESYLKGEKAKTVIAAAADRIKELQDAELAKGTEGREDAFDNNKNTEA